MAGVDADVDAAELDPLYRSVSTLAIVALVLGVAAPLALVSRLLVVLPCGALLAAWVALRRIAASDGALVGRAPALAAVALGVVSLSAVFARDAVRSYRLNAQAAPAARQWLKTVEGGHLREAFLLTIPPRQRSAAAEQLEDPTSEYAVGWDDFRELPDLAPLLAPQEITSVELRARGRPQDAGYGRLALVQEYDVYLEGRDQPVRYALTLQRSEPSDAAPAEWRVAQARLSGQG